MTPIAVPPLVKWSLALVGGAVVVHWVVREFRRVNAELDQIRLSPTRRAGKGSDYPTLRRDAASGEYRL